MSTRFLCEYCALTLALLTAAASMALLERVGVERGEPLVKGEEVTAAKTKTKTECNEVAKQAKQNHITVGIRIPDIQIPETSKKRISLEYPKQNFSLFKCFNSLHWIILVFFYAFFVQWSIFRLENIFKHLKRNCWL